MEKRALGKGLSALIPDKVDFQTEIGRSESVAYVKTAQIRENPQQPRLNYDSEKLQELIMSIRDKGVLQPILVREAMDGYEVIAGERRLKAARTLNLEEVPVIIKKVTDQEALVLALVENIQREELNPIEEAHAFRRLINEFNLNQEEVGRSVGKDSSTISNTMRLLNLPDDIQQSLIAGHLSMGHARALLSIPDDQEQRQIYEKILHTQMSVRELENLIKTGLQTAARRKKVKARTHEQIFLEEELQKLLGTKVRIHAQRKRGKIIIEYYSLEDLERILQIIKGPQ